MIPYPLLFTPLLKPKVWGGRTLARYGKPLSEGVAIGESWEIADLPESIAGGRSIIANGPLAGQTLRQAIAAHRAAIMGDARLTAEGGFPLLIKYLDARENLSVQVHPDAAYAAAHPEAHLKSEAWVVIEAQPGAVIYKGVKPHVTPAQFARHIQDNTVVDDLVAVPAKAGDCHYLPSGTCHALGAGIMVAEVQTPSDTTFRVYDWGRTGPGRELHIEQALRCIRFGDSPRPHKPQRPMQAAGLKTTLLTQTDYFAIERVEGMAADGRFTIETSGLPEVWMMVGGEARIEPGGGPPLLLGPGRTALVPAAMQGARAMLQPDAWMLRVRLPSPLQGLIA